MTMTFTQTFTTLREQGKLEERHRAAFQRICQLNAHAPRNVELYARLARREVALESGAGEPGAAAPADRLIALAAERPAPEPTGDEALVQLHGDVRARAAEEQVGWWTAASRTVSDPRLIEEALEAAPLKIEDGVDPEQAELDRRAREVARSLQVGYMDALGLIELDDELAEAEAETGRANVPWADTSTPRPPQPYGEQGAEDWQRDQLRAKIAGVQVNKDYWQSAAEQGVDLVYELARDARAARVAELQAKRDQLLEQACSVERVKRQRALGAELDRRARERLR